MGGNGFTLFILEAARESGRGGGLGWALALGLAYPYYLQHHENLGRSIRMV